MEQVYRKKMEVPIEDMKRFLDGILHIHAEGRTRMSMGALFGIVAVSYTHLHTHRYAARSFHDPFHTSAGLGLSLIHI